MAAAIRIARRYAAHRPLAAAAMIGCFLIAGLVESVGILALLPLIEQVGMAGRGTPNPIVEFVSEAFGLFGLQPGVLGLLVLIAATMVLKTAIMIGTRLFVAVTVADLTATLRRTLARAVLTARWDFFVHRSIGTLTAALTSQSERSAQTTRNTLMLAATLIQVMFYAGSAFLVSWRITVGAIVLGLIILFALNGFVHMARRSGARLTTLTASLTQSLVDGIQGLKPLKAMAREERLFPVLDNQIGQLRHANVQHGISVSALTNLPELVVILFLTGGTYVALTQLSTPISEVLVVGFLGHRTITRLFDVQNVLQKVAVGLDAFALVEDQTRDAESQREWDTGTLEPRFEEAIAFENVAVAFDSTKVLRGIDMVIPARGMTAVVGPSGSGKTTLTDLLVGLRRPDAGIVRVDGVPLDDIDLKKWRRLIGYVPQEFTLFNDTILANVTLGEPDLDRTQAEAALRAAEVWDFVAGEPDGVDTVVGERGMRISGGQRQRIALARAIIHEPRLLILDEATAALDPDTASRIGATLVKLSETIAIVAISHQPVFTKFADRVYRIQQGRITDTEQPTAVAAGAGGAPRT